MTSDTKQIGLLSIFVLAIAFAGIAMSQIGAVSNPSEDTQTSEDTYNLAMRQIEFEDRVADNAYDKDALFALARIYYITGDTSAALGAIAEYKERFPEEKRIHYVAGLANAYANNLTTAEEEFRAFIDSGLARWPGYLDLAWVYFKKGEFDTAQIVLDAAIEEFGDNMWLNTSRGAVALAKGDAETALGYLAVAREQVEYVTAAEWQANYSYNNPALFEEEIAQMRAVIDTNIAYAVGDDNPTGLTDVLSSTFASASPLGVSKGLAVSACGDSCTTTQCISASNVCGDVNIGTQSSCGGGCSVGVPANPTGTCSVATACGVNATGFNGCSGTCNITRYPVCTTVQNPDGDGAIEWITINAGENNGALGATDVTATISVVPSLVSSGASTVVRWLATEADSCEITSSSNGDVWNGTFGQQLSSAIEERTTYTITCQGYDDSVVTDTATVDIVPEWQEF